MCTIYSIYILYFIYILFHIISFSLFLFFFFLTAPQHMEFPGQGSDPSRNCDLCHSCSNTGSLLNPLCQAGDRTCRCRDTVNPVVPQWELLFFIFFILFFIFGCSVQRLDVGSQFPDQGLNPSPSSESVKS